MTRVFTPAQQEANRQRARKWYLANREKANANARRYQATQKRQVLETARKYRGLPVPTRDCPLLCEMCGCSSTQALALDHCHATGKFRGWLCGKCNTGLGKLGDNVEGLERAIAYLRRADGS